MKSQMRLIICKVEIMMFLAPDSLDNLLVKFCQNGSASTPKGSRSLDVDNISSFFPDGNLIKLQIISNIRIYQIYFFILTILFFWTSNIHFW